MSRLVQYGKSYDEMTGLTEAQWKALVVLIAHGDDVDVSKTTDLERPSVNGSAVRALEEKGFAIVKPQRLDVGCLFKAECTDRAWLWACEHTSTLEDAVRAAEKKLGRSWRSVKGASSHERIRKAAARR